jgi:hypothetical protein
LVLCRWRLSRSIDRDNIVLLSLKQARKHLSTLKSTLLDNNNADDGEVKKVDETSCLISLYSKSIFDSIEQKFKSIRLQMIENQLLMLL